MNNTAIKQAYETLEYISQDPAERARYEARRKYQLDYNTGMPTAEERGIEKGISLGLEKGKAEVCKIENFTIAKQMLKHNFPIDQIAAITQLSAEEVSQLKSK